MAAAGPSNVLISTLHSRIICKVGELMKNNCNESVYVGQPIAISLARGEVATQQVLNVLVGQRVKQRFRVKDAAIGDVSQSAIIVTLEPY